ncbi:uncharacterized protein ACNS7B_005710 isoform 2-T2 [Menidia menidia]
MNCGQSHLLIVVLIYSFHDVRAQAKLTVNPAVITETDNVTLSCEAPSYVSVSQCYFYNKNSGTEKPLPCHQTLSGAELLQKYDLSSPGEVKVNCYYIAQSGAVKSPYSDFSSIKIQGPSPAKLTVNPAVITETDMVTLSCEAPSSVSVPQCYFNSSDGGTIRELSCHQTLKGAKLLQILGLSSPAEVKVSCYYIPKSGAVKSPYSDFSSIKIQGPAVGQPVTKNTSPPANFPEIFLSRNPWKSLVIVTGCGVAVGLIMVVFALVKTQKRADTSVFNRTQAHLSDCEMDTLHHGKMSTSGSGQAIITTECDPAADHPPGLAEQTGQEPQTDCYDIHHFYCYIAEEPLNKPNVLYHTADPH